MDFQFPGPLKLQVDRMLSAFPQIQGANLVEKLAHLFRSNDQKTLSAREPSAVFLCQALQESKCLICDEFVFDFWF
jgi:hypothetical protein